MRHGSAEQLPFPDGQFDAAIAQLVVHFMTDPVAGLAEMARVTHTDGVVAACVWDHAGGQGPLSVFWEAAHELDPAVEDESRLAGAREGHLQALFAAAGLREVTGTTLAARREYRTFDEWWEPYTLGVGPAGAYVAGLNEDGRAALRDRCRSRFPDEPFAVTAQAWAASGRV